jgi:ABC-type nitrate/sulfonate/bicarbonate transport system permease component
MALLRFGLLLSLWLLLPARTVSHWLSGWMQVLPDFLVGGMIGMALALSTVARNAGRHPLWTMRWALAAAATTLLLPPSSLRIAMIVLTGLFTLRGLRSIDPGVATTAAELGLSRPAQYLRVWIPGGIANIATGWRLGTALLLAWPLLAIPSPSSPPEGAPAGAEVWLAVLMLWHHVDRSIEASARMLAPFHLLRH